MAAVHGKSLHTLSGYRLGHRPGTFGIYQSTVVFAHLYTVGLAASYTCSLKIRSVDDFRCFAVCWDVWLIEDWSIRCIDRRDQTAECSRWMWEDAPVDCGVFRSIRDMAVTASQSAPSDPQVPQQLSSGYRACYLEEFPYVSICQRLPLRLHHSIHWFLQSNMTSLYSRFSMWTVMFLRQSVTERSEGRLCSSRTLRHGGHWTCHQMIKIAKSLCWIWPDSLRKHHRPRRSATAPRLCRCRCWWHDSSQSDTSSRISLIPLFHLHIVVSNAARSRRTWS